MARATYVLRDGQLVEKRLAPPLHEAADAPYVIPDTMDPTRNHADRKVYDSKRAFAQATRRAGCVEIGNERLPERRPVEVGGVGRDIKHAIEQIRGRT